MSVLVDPPSWEELASLSAGGLERALVEWERVRRIAESVILDVIDHADRRRVYADDGHASVRNWVQTLTNGSRSEATRRVQSMHAMRDLELVRDRLRAGELGLDQLRAITKVHANPRCARQLPDSEALLVGHATHLAWHDFTIVLRRWEALADADGAHRAHERAHDDRDAFIVQVGTEFHLGAQCGTAQGAALGEIFDRFIDAEFHADWDNARAQFGDAVTKELLARSDRQRRFDALFAIFHAAGSTAPGAQPPEPVVNILIDETSFEEHLAARLAGGPPPLLDPADVDRRRCETATGIPIDPADAVVAALIGHVRRVVVDTAGVVIDLGRKRRLFTGAARDAVLLSNQHCCWQGCGLPAHRSQIDHILPWAHNGPTNPTNGAPACGRHNRWKTRGYTTHRDPTHHWLILRPDGTPITQPRAA